MKISFIPTSKFAEDCLAPPQPAASVLPQWYKNTPMLANGNAHYTVKSGIPNSTIKACSPFLDAFTSGYVFCLSSDIELFNDGNEVSVSWKHEHTFVTSHQKSDAPLLPPLYNGQDAVLKFQNDFIIKTPKGYSTYFTHPLNRYDMPFHTLSAVVDTDTYMQPVHFPFQLFGVPEGATVLAKGTPVCQFIPFKRESWEHDVQPYDETLVNKERFKYQSRIYKAYKALHWVKKTFK